MESLETPQTTLLENSPGFIATSREADAYGAPLSLVGVRAPEALHAPVEEWTDAQAESFTVDVSQLAVPSDARLEMTPSQCGAAGSVLCYVINSQVRIPLSVPSPETEISASPSAPSHPTETAVPADNPGEAPVAANTPASSDSASPAATSLADGGQQHVETLSKSKAWITNFEKGTVADSLTLLSDEGKANLAALIAEHLVSEGKVEAESVQQFLAVSPSPGSSTPASEGSPAPGSVPSSTAEGSEALPEIFDAVFLNSDGSVTVLVSQGSLLPSEEGMPSFLVTETVEGKIASLLTPEGLALRDVLISGDEPTPIPEPPVNCEEFSCVALTFDDGPGPYTAQLLDTLAEKDAKATFFVIGRSVANDPAMVAREAQEGHVVANHSWSHPSLPKLSLAGMETELEQTDQAIEDAGVARPFLVRPPYGDENSTLLSLLGQRGQVAVLWDVDTLDWKNRDVSKNIRSTVDNTRPGSIILMHDIHPESVQAVPAIIDQLEAEGYIFVTVPELLGGDVSPYTGMTVLSQHNIR